MKTRMKYRTRENIVKTAMNFLLKQGARSQQKGEGNRCALRGDNGTRCAIGCLIPNREYDPKFEGYSVIFEPKIQSAARIHPNDHLLAQDVQDIHDNLPPRAWKAAFQKLLNEVQKDG